MSNGDGSTRARRSSVSFGSGVANTFPVCYEPGTMFEVRHETCVAAAHQLRVSPGEGERLHGHNWRIVAVVRCRELDARGMVVDFNDLGAELRRLVEPYEHVFLNEIPPYDDINPTAENIARVVADALAATLDNERVKVHRVEVWETDTCGATYYRGAT